MSAEKENRRRALMDDDEGVYERKLLEERLFKTSGSNHSTIETIETIEAGGGSFKKMPSAIELAYITGFMAGHNFNSTAVNPKKQAVYMAAQYTKQESAK